MSRADRLSLVFAGLIGVAALGAKHAPATADPEGLLRRAIAAPRSISYVGQVETVRFSTARATATIERIEHRAPGMTRRWYLAPPALYGDYSITRGGSTYDVDVKHASVTVTRLPAIGDEIVPNATLALVVANYRPLVGAQETVAGRAARAITLLNKYSGERALRIWVDDKTGLILKREAYHANGAIASVTRFEELRYTNDIPTELFATTTPAGYREVVGADVAAPTGDIQRAVHDAGFDAASPTYLPQGFMLVGASVDGPQGVRTLHLFYSDGVRDVSLFENATGAAADFVRLHPHPVAIGNRSGSYVEDGPTTLLAWKGKALHYVLVGDVSRGELVEIAESIKS